MHARGIGLPKDNHLAKRYHPLSCKLIDGRPDLVPRFFDKSIQLDPNQATIPSRIALFVLDVENALEAYRTNTHKHANQAVEPHDAVGSPDEAVKRLEALPGDTLAIVILSILLVVTFAIRNLCF